MITGEFEITSEVDGDAEGTVDAEAAAAAQQFYCGVLSGRQVWAAGELWFLVEGVLVETGPRVREHVSSLALPVQDPERLATRCWNAGFTVRAHEDPSGRTALALVDPFGLEIELISRA